MECDALKDWKLNIFKMIHRRISFCSQDADMLPRESGVGCHYLRLGSQEFRGECVLAPADGAAGSVVVVWRLRCIGAL